MSFSSFQFESHLLENNCQALLAGERNYIANAANISSLVFHSLSTLNWVGFYFLDITSTSKELVLGPFIGKPACIRIPLGKGVCGTSASTSRTIVVDDVHLFEGHIACDSASNSEVVIPIIKNNVLLGVFDIDSPIKKRFSQEDVNLLEKIVNFYVESSNFS
jgi:L-methionine (R)-S-oxide reductase